MIFRALNFGTLAAQEILGPRGQPLAFGKQPEFDENDEVYRIHFYPKTGSEKDEYVLFKVSLILIKIFLETKSFRTWVRALRRSLLFHVQEAFNDVS